MTDRDMSYSLDGVFSTRNQGQLVSTVQTQSKTIRTPGLAAVREPLANFGHVMGAETPPAAPGMINLPIIGKVKTSQAIIGAGVIAVLGLMLFRKR